ncbi:MAG TPA: metal-dependent transcriptional regulator [Saprospiraceae bacterium]|nr:metal-dependent transcriptional regulator [Saprospiraceae bacterium]
MTEQLSQTEENYLKGIYKLSEKTEKTVNTNAIANEMNTTAASVTDMLQKLSAKELIHYEKYRGVTLTEKGNRAATQLVRKHRLWEVFLVEKLQYTWDEVHELAEQLEHIQSSDLVDRLDIFLGNPKFDPHGDPIPDAEGKFTFRKQIELSEMDAGETGVVVGVQDHSSAFLKYLDLLGLVLGTQVKVLETFEYDRSKKIIAGQSKELILSHKICKNLFIKLTE